MSQHLARRLAARTLVAVLALLLAGVATPGRAAPAPQPPSPTASPQPATPTAPPSDTPTAAPSDTPTGAPTATDAASPTGAPTATDAASPTGAPTATDAASPTGAATAAATAELAATATAATPTLPRPVAAPAQAVSLAISKTLRGSDVVQVGQYLTFTIQITNTGSESITVLPLVDEYDTSLLQPFPERASPPPTTSAPGVMRWADLTGTFGDLAPGETVVVTVVFRAIRITGEVINQARVEAAQGSGGGGGGSGEDQAGGKVEGGRVIVEKSLVKSFIRLDTPVISFTLSLRNEGSADIVRAPFADTYRADLLSFLSASVPPDAHNPATGELRWNDLLVSLGVARLRPGETISFTTTYRVIGPIDDAVVNSADAVGVADEFGNQVSSPRRAEVRIRIGAPDAQATPTPAQEEPTPDEQRTSRPARTPTPSAAPASATPASTEAPAATPAATAAPAGGEAQPIGTPQATAAPAAAEAPKTLPSTGSAGSPAGVLLVALLALAAGVALLAALRGRHG